MPAVAAPQSDKPGMPALRFEPARRCRDQAIGTQSGTRQRLASGCVVINRRIATPSIATVMVIQILALPAISVRFSGTREPCRDMCAVGNRSDLRPCACRPSHWRGIAVGFSVKFCHACRPSTSSHPGAGQVAFVPVRIVRQSGHVCQTGLFASAELFRWKPAVGPLVPVLRLLSCPDGVPEYGPDARKHNGWREICDRTVGR